MRPIKKVCEQVKALEDMRPGTYCLYLGVHIVFIRGYLPFAWKDGKMIMVELTHECIIRRLEYIW